MPTHAKRHKRPRPTAPARKRHVYARTGIRAKFVRVADYKPLPPRRVADLPPPQVPEEAFPTTEEYLFSRRRSLSFWGS